MRLSDPGALLIANSEGFSATPYRKKGDRWTIGYGSTSGVGPNTPRVTRAQALARLKREVDANYGAAVNRIGVPLNQNQYDALCSFTYNLGPGAVAADTGIGRALRARDYGKAANELLRWTKGPPGTYAGLRARRERERALFLKPPPDRFRNLPAKERAVARKIESHRHGALVAPKGSAAEKKHARWRDHYKRLGRVLLRAIQVAARTKGLGGWNRKIRGCKLTRGARYQLLEDAVEDKP
jgi:lysozyme